MPGAPRLPGAPAAPADAPKERRKAMVRSGAPPPSASEAAAEERQRNQKARMAELTQLIISGRATDADNIELERLAAAVGAQAGPAVPLSTTLSPAQNGTPGAGLDASQLQLAVAVI